MSHKNWSRHTDEDVAVDALLDAAGRAFVEHGVAKASMVDVAREAGCSRATLYRYFANQSELHLAHVQRATLRIAAAMAASRTGATDVDPAADLVDRIVTGIAAVRADPILAVWFEPENLAVPLRVSQESDVLQSGAAAAIARLVPGLPQDECERRGAWLMRCIVSFLAMPAREVDDERDAIAAFVVPALLADATTPSTTDNTTGRTT